MTDQPPLPQDIWDTLSPGAEEVFDWWHRVRDGTMARATLRTNVFYRKLSGGTASESGSRFVERMLSVVATCRQQDISVLDCLTRCYRAHLDGQPAPSLLPSEPVIQAA